MLCHPWPWSIKMPLPHPFDCASISSISALVDKFLAERRVNVSAVPAVEPAPAPAPPAQQPQPQSPAKAAKQTPATPPRKTPPPKLANQFSETVRRRIFIGLMGAALLGLLVRCWNKTSKAGCGSRSASGRRWKPTRRWMPGKAGSMEIRNTFG